MSGSGTIQHHLILVTGSSPGVGKSTLSRLLFQQLRRHRLPARWLHEDDLVAAFAQYVPALTTGPETPERLLAGSAALVDACAAERVTYIVDSYLPGLYYLYGRYPDPQVAAYSGQLHTVLHPLHPFVIYLRSDVETALLRGVRQRGAAWLDTIRRYLNGWELPYYGATLKPLRTVADVISFFTRVDDLAVPLLGAWRHTLMLEAIQTPVEELLTTVLAQLDLTQAPDRFLVPADELCHYVGVYVAAAEQPPAPSLELTLVNDALHVNTYWPAGTRLVPDGVARFHLDGTNRHIVFDGSVHRAPGRLTYYVGETAYAYTKRVEQQ